MKSYSMEETIKREIEFLFPEIVRIRRKLHENPERATEEFETNRIIKECLDEWGIPWHQVADTGIVGWLNGKGNAGHDENVVGLRADIDALPIEEDEMHSCRSKIPGMMHACGHDAHTAILLGTIKLLQMHQKEWSGTVKFFFQPAEEADGGAQRMIAEGCMENPIVDYVAALHMDPTLRSGQIEVKHGKTNASSDEVILHLYGKGCHGAYPENGIDAILIASQVVVALQAFVSRTISPLNSAVLTFGKIEGGTAGNIICDHVTLTGTLRTLDPETRELAKGYIKKQAISIAEAFGGSADVKFRPGYQALINSNSLVDLFAETAAEWIGKENIFWKEFPSMGVEDFAFFISTAKAGVMYNLGCTLPEQDEIYPLHTTKFEIDEESLKTGMLLQYVLTRKLLCYKE